MYDFTPHIEAILFKNLSERLNYALELTGTKKADLARSINVKPQIIQFLCNSQTQSSRFAFEIATALGLSTRWLATGEGEAFLANDPRQQFLDTYKSIPLLNINNIREVFLHDNPPNQETIKESLPLRTTRNDIFAFEITDTSMEPVFQVGSYVFIKKCPKGIPSGHKYLLCYLGKFDTLIVRELIDHGAKKILVPKNIDLFKEIIVTEDVTMLGVITDYFWHVGS